MVVVTSCYFSARGTGNLVIIKGNIDYKPHIINFSSSQPKTCLVVKFMSQQWPGPGMSLVKIRRVWAEND